MEEIPDHNLILWNIIIYKCDTISESARNSSPSLLYEYVLIANVYTKVWSGALTLVLRKEQTQLTSSLHLLARY